MKVIPFHKYLIIDREVIDNVTKSGIVLSSDKKPAQVATILEVSEELQLDELFRVSVGDRVIINQYAPLELDINGKIITIINCEDVYGKVEE